MIVGCGEWGFRALPIEEHFRIARDLGFHYLEFGIGGGRDNRLPEDPSDEDLAAFVAMAADYGIAAPFCCLENDFVSLSPARHDREVFKALRQIGSAARCGATHVRLFAGWTPAAEVDDAVWQRMIDAFARCDALCAREGMVIAVETHGVLREKPDGSVIHIDSVTTNPAFLQRLLEELPPRVGFNYDVGNLKPFDDGSRTYQIDLLNDRINYCHMKDWRRVGVDAWTACAAGDDDLDYRPILERMRYDGVHLIEYEPLYDTVAGIRRSLAYLRSITEVELA